MIKIELNLHVLKEEKREETIRCHVDKEFVHPIICSLQLLMISKTIIAQMSSKLAIKPRTHFLKKQGQSNLYSGSRLGFNLHKPTHVPSGAATKESLELKDYAEKMMREQRMSSQKLNQLV